MYETGADWSLEWNWWEKTKIISEMKTKLQGTQWKIGITQSSVKDKKIEVKKSRKWNWNKESLKDQRESDRENPYI